MLYISQKSANQKPKSPRCGEKKYKRRLSGKLRRLTVNTKKMKVKKNWLVAITVVLTLALTLAGCSNPTSEDDYVSASRHVCVFGDWQVIQFPTATERGIQEQYCITSSFCPATNREYLDFVVTNGDEWDKVIEEIKKNGSDKEITIVISGDIDITPVPYGACNLTFGHAERVTVTLKGSGTLNLKNGAGHMLSLGKTQTLVIDSADLTLIGNNYLATYSSIIGVGNGGKVLLNNGTLTGNTSVCGGGVYVYGDGTFAMNGGLITGNTATLNGAGVKVEPNGTFAMNNGKISENNAAYGGGVYVYGAGNFYIAGGEISDNTGIGAALYKSSAYGTAQVGTLVNGVWEGSNLSTDNDAIIVVNGVKQ